MSDEGCVTHNGDVPCEYCSWHANAPADTEEDGAKVKDNVRVWKGPKGGGEDEPDPEENLVGWYWCENYRACDEEED